MNIYYKAQRRPQPGIKGGGKTKYVAKIVYAGEVNEEAFYRRMSEHSRLSYPDAFYAAMIFQQVLQDCLCEGKYVRLKILGTCYPQFSARAVDTEKQVRPQSIRNPSLHLRPTKEFQERLFHALKKVKP